MKKPVRERKKLRLAVETIRPLTALENVVGGFRPCTNDMSSCHSDTGGSDNC